MKLRVHPRHVLLGQLRHTIGTHRLGRMILLVGQRVGLSVHRRRTRKDHSLDVGILRCLQEIDCPVDVDVGHLSGVVYARPYARLRGLVDDDVFVTPELKSCVPVLTVEIVGINILDELECVVPKLFSVTNGDIEFRR